MKTRHAVPLAFMVTWLLIQPPVRPTGNGTFDYDAKIPISEWAILKRFQHTDDCIAEMDKLETQFDQAWEHMQPTTYDYAFAMAHSWSQCVESNDPRLKDK